MSYIDTIDHSYLGLFQNIPVYHPMEKDREYNLNDKCIVLGGGDGEHNMFVIHNAEECLKFYIYHFTNDFDFYPENQLYSSYWNIENGYYFFNKIKKNMKKLKVNYAEKYILLSVAEYLRFNGRHLISKELLETMSKMEGLPDTLLFNEVNDETSDISFGRIYKDEKVIWGYSLEEEYQDHIKK